MGYSMASATLPFCVPFVCDGILIGQRLSFSIHTLTLTGAGQQFNFATQGPVIVHIVLQQRWTMDIGHDGRRIFLNFFTSTDWLHKNIIIIIFSVAWWTTTELISMHSNVMAEWRILIGCQTKNDIRKALTIVRVPAIIWIMEDAKLVRSKRWDE